MSDFDDTRLRIFLTAFIIAVAPILTIIILAWLLHAAGAR